jgi:uncharacterized protein (DUF2267 family)
VGVLAAGAGEGVAADPVGVPQAISNSPATATFTGRKTTKNSTPIERKKSSQAFTKSPPSVGMSEERSQGGPVMATAPSRRPDAIDTTVQKTYGWLHDLTEEFGGISREEAYEILRGFLHTLRDRLPVDEAAHLGAQLPMLIRGLYYEGWDPSRVPRKMKAEEFLEAFARQSGYQPDARGIQALQAANRVLRRHIAEGEALDVMSSMPKDIRELLA